jgi:hypothetical protein
MNLTSSICYIKMNSYVEENTDLINILYLILLTKLCVGKRKTLPSLQHRHFQY